MATAITRLQFNGLLNLGLAQKDFRKPIKTKNHQGMGKHYIRGNKEMPFCHVTRDYKQKEATLIICLNSDF